VLEVRPCLGVAICTHIYVEDSYTARTQDSCLSMLRGSSLASDDPRLHSILDGAESGE
jgi:hypothetical protein